MKKQRNDLHWQVKRMQCTGAFALFEEESGEDEEFSTRELVELLEQTYSILGVAFSTK